MLRQCFLAVCSLLALVACHPLDNGQTQTTSHPTTTPPAQVQQQTTDPQSGLRWISPRSLPAEGQQVLRQIAAGGPFRYSKDGVTFSNREGILPRQSRGYYREYTVPTPGASNRATRRIICGGQPVTSTGDCYYTADHYATFKKIGP